MKLLYIHYAGHFADTYQKVMVEGERENYYGQKYTLEAIDQQLSEGHEILIVTFLADKHDVRVAPGLRSVGLGGPSDKRNRQRLFTISNSFRPDRCVIRFPDIWLLRFLRKSNIPTLPTLADSFHRPDSPRAWFRQWLLSRELRNSHLRWLANHQVNAARSLVALGVKADRVLPYDWAHSQTPEDWFPSEQSLEGGDLALFFAGALIRKKGIFDCLHALKHLRDRGVNANIRIAGKGDKEALEHAIRDLEIADNVALLGSVSHDRVLEEMHAAHLTIVPSHHEYPEGLPMTIMESLMVHTPVVSSDHPMFVGRIGTEGAVIFFSAQDSRDLAEHIASIAVDNDRYRGMVSRCPAEWHGLCLDLKWADLVNQWIKDPQSPQLRAHSLEHL